MKTLLRIILTLIAFILIPSLGAAQTTTAQLAWNYPVSLAEVQSYTQAVSIDGTVVTTVPTCTSVSPTNTECRVVANQLATGTHSASISATKGNVTQTTVVNGLTTVPPNGPVSPTLPRVIITVTVSVGGTP